MNIYSYTFNDETVMTSRDLFNTYPTLDELQSVLDSKIPYNLVMRLVTAYYTGVADTEFIKIEESWWDKQSAIQDNNTLLNDLVRLQPTSYTDISGIVLQYTNDVLVNNAAELGVLLTTHNYPDASTGIDELTAVIAELEAERDVIENGTNSKGTNLWLTEYRGVPALTDRPVPTPVIPKHIRKTMASNEIGCMVRDTGDSIADLAKMNSLLFSMVTTMYSTLSTTAKNKIPAAERGVIEYATTQFSNIQTRADRQLTTEGTVLIDRLFKREVDIADIVDKIMK